MPRIEWVGCATPASDEQVSLRKIAKMYTPDQEDIIDALSILLAPRVRFDGSRMREMGKRDGLSQEYQWGLRVYVVEMTDLDARRLFALPDGHEFRVEGDTSRQPIVPPGFMTKAVMGILDAAKHGRPFYTNEPAVYQDAEGMLKAYDEVLRQKEAKTEEVDWYARRGRLDTRQMHLRQSYLRGERGPKLGEVPLHR